jgi:hypothetical protein
LTNLNENINYTVVISIDAGELFESASAILQKKIFNTTRINIPDLVYFIPFILVSVIQKCDYNISN